VLRDRRHVVHALSVFRLIVYNSKLIVMFLMSYLVDKHIRPFLCK
jgi:hypothetical protein